MLRQGGPQGLTCNSQGSLHGALGNLQTFTRGLQAYKAYFIGTSRTIGIGGIQVVAHGVETAIKTELQTGAVIKKLETWQRRK